jgi:hypothetical protein
MTDAMYLGGGRWTVTHRRDDYPEGVYEQPNATFTHSAVWASYCTLCAFDVRMAGL